MKKKEDYNLIIKRLDRLEEYVFGAEGTKKLQKTKKGYKFDFSGPTGGLRFLILRRFFRAKKNFSDVRTELEKHGYHYSPQAVDTGLRRLSKLKGPLVSIKQRGRKFYGERK